MVASFRYLALAVLLLICLAGYGQTHFASGYFIDTSGKRTECLINDLDWSLVPKYIDYKLTEGGATERIDAENLTEFSVGRSKHVKARVRYDKSNQEIKNLSTSRTPDWTEGELFLKVLVEGKATLYHYHPQIPNNFNLFFYSKDGGPIEQLEFKNYMSTGSAVSPTATQNAGYNTSVIMATNLTYINQLNNDVKCENRTADPKYVKYTAPSLVLFFTNYNACMQSNFIDFTRRTERMTAVRLKVGADAGYARWTFLNSDFPSQTNMRFGVEVEALLPFRNNKWAVFFEPTSQTYTGRVTRGAVVYDMKYAALEIPLAVRHYFHFGNNFRLFLNGGAVFDIPFTYTVTVSGTTESVIDAEQLKIHLAGGAGLAWKRLSAEFRQYSPQVGLDQTGSYNFEYRKSALVVGVKIY